MGADDVMARLARQIDAAAQRERALADMEEIASLRLRGAGELHRVCAAFVASLNSRIAAPAVELSPPEWTAEMLREPGVNLVQIVSQGRILQIAFEAPVPPVSTEKFAIPYVLEGELRAYNQQMLERFEIRSRLLYYCVERGEAAWRVFDWRTKWSGPLDCALLAGVMESLF